MNKLLTIVIPTFHRNDLLELCLNRLAPGKQTLAFENYEVIVTDDGVHSTAASLIDKKYPWAYWMEGPHRGPAANRNSGAKYAKGEWLVFTDDDCLPDPQWLASYTQAIQEHPNVLVFEGRTYADRPKRRLDEEAPINETGGYLWSCNFAINKRLFFDVGAFDESFPYAAMEDVDLNYRIRKNYKALFIKGASVCHPYRRSKKWVQLRNHHKSTLYFIDKFPEKSKDFGPAFYLRALVFYIFKVLIVNINNHRLRGFHYALFYMWHLLLNFAISIKLLCNAKLFSSQQ